MLGLPMGRCRADQMVGVASGLVGSTIAQGAPEHIFWPFMSCWSLV